MLSSTQRYCLLSQELHVCTYVFLLALARAGELVGRENSPPPLLGPPQLTHWPSGSDLEGGSTM